MADEVEEGASVEMMKEYAQRCEVLKAEFDERCKAYLVDIFEAAPSVFMQSSKDAAEISYALMIG